MKYFLYCLKHYADFSGRARCSEFWYFQLFRYLFICLSAILLSVMPFIGIIGIFGLIVPNFAVTARRLHDTNRSGWWQLLTLIPELIITIGLSLAFASSFARAFGGNAYNGQDPIVSFMGYPIGISMLIIIPAEILLLAWYCTDSQQGVNRFGPNPKEENNANPDQ